MGVNECSLSVDLWPSNLLFNAEANAFQLPTINKDICFQENESVGLYLLEHFAGKEPHNCDLA